MYSPLEQFAVIQLFFNSTYFFWITNLTVYLFLYLIIIFFFFIQYFIFNPKFLTKFSPSLVTSVFINIKYFLCDNSTLCNFFLFWLYILIIDLFFFNIFGLLPYSFTITTHLIISLSLSFFFFCWINFIYFLRFQKNWINVFVPSGAPLPILFLLIPIELLSYVSRILSLSIRLFANMMSGHTLLAILTTFLYLNLSLIFIILIPITLLHLIIFMEIGVAFLQIYVFLILSKLYVQDTLDPLTH